MRIAVWHNLPSGGGKRALYDHVKGLVGRGHKIEAWCPPTADQHYLPLRHLVKEHIVPLKVPERRFGDRLGLTIWIEQAISSMDQHCEACAEEIERGSFDVIFANTCRFYRTTAIGRLAKIPAILYLQEPYRWLYEALPSLPWIALPKSDSRILNPFQMKAWLLDLRTIRNARVQAREEVRNAAGFKKILVNSQFSRESVLRAYGLDARVCYLGVDTQLFQRLDREKQDLVVGLGSITPEKNVGLVIEAIGSMTGQKPKLVWIGNMVNQNYLAEMKSLSHLLSVDCEFGINIPDERVLEILSEAFAMVYAPRLEPFGLAPLEANACGLPVIAVPEGGVRETVIDGVNGLLVEPDPVAIGNTIRSLRDDPELARQIGMRGRVCVEQKFGMASAIDRLELELMQYAH